MWPSIAATPDPFVIVPSRHPNGEAAGRKRIQRFPPLRLKAEAIASASAEEKSASIGISSVCPTILGTKMTHGASPEVPGAVCGSPDGHGVDLF
jgi:hypothetical protein